MDPCFLQVRGTDSLPGCSKAGIGPSCQNLTFAAIIEIRAIFTGYHIAESGYAACPEIRLPYLPFRRDRHPGQQHIIGHLRPSGNRTRSTDDRFSFAGCLQFKGRSQIIETGRSGQKIFSPGESDSHFDARVPGHILSHVCNNTFHRAPRMPASSCRIVISVRSDIKNACAGGLLRHPRCCRPT